MKIYFVIKYRPSIGLVFLKKKYIGLISKKAKNKKSSTIK